MINQFESQTLSYLKYLTCIINAIQTQIKWYETIMMRYDFIIECLEHEIGKNLSLLTDTTVIHNFSEK